MGAQQSPTLRAQIYARMKAALGEPEVSSVKSGDMYRWTLARALDVNVYVTMDSPEREDLAHIMISDSTKYQDKPIVSTIVYSLDELDALIQRILKQWRQAP